MNDRERPAPSRLGALRILNFRDCEGNFVNDRGFGPTEFTFSPSLQTATLSGTITTFGGRSVTVDMAWEGTGPIEVENNTTIFEDFTGHFQGKRRDAVASGTVLVNGETLADGSTTERRVRDARGHEHQALITNRAETLRKRGSLPADRLPSRLAGKRGQNVLAHLHRTEGGR